MRMLKVQLKVDLQKARILVEAELKKREKGNKTTCEFRANDNPTPRDR